MLLPDTRQRRTVHYLCVFAASMALAACSQRDAPAPSDDDPSPTETTGLALTSDTLADTDIEKMQFTVQRVDCATGQPSGPTQTATEPYEDMYLPGALASFRGEPYQEDSRHIFADRFFTVDAGCYDVTTQPLRANEQNSRDCKPAHESGVRVEDGDTTEILMVNQCEGAKRGGLDVIGAINHPPQIEDITYTPSKFLSCDGGCHETVEICMTAEDPDGDPLRAQRPEVTGPEPLTPPTVTTTESGGSLEQCVSLKPGNGNWTIVFRVFDQIHRDNELIDVETYLEESQTSTCQTQSNIPCESRDDLRIPLYGSECSAPCGDEPDVGFDGGAPADTPPAPDAGDAGVPSDTDDGQMATISQSCNAGGVDENEDENEDEDEGGGGGSYTYTYVYDYEYEKGDCQYDYHYEYEWSETAEQNPQPTAPPVDDSLACSEDCAGISPDPSPSPSP